MTVMKANIVMVLFLPVTSALNLNSAKRSVSLPEGRPVVDWLFGEDLKAVEKSKLQEQGCYPNGVKVESTYALHCRLVRQSKEKLRKEREQKKVAAKENIRKEKYTEMTPSASFLTHSWFCFMTTIIVCYIRQNYKVWDESTIEAPTSVEKLGHLSWQDVFSILILDSEKHGLENCSLRYAFLIFLLCLALPRVYILHRDPKNFRAVHSNFNNYYPDNNWVNNLNASIVTIFLLVFGVCLYLTFPVTNSGLLVYQFAWLLYGYFLIRNLCDPYYEVKERTIRPCYLEQVDNLKKSRKMKTKKLQQEINEKNN